MSGVAARAARGVFLEVGWVRSAVRAQKEFGAATGGRLNQRQAMRLAFEHRQAVVMGADAACEDGVAVV